MIGGVLDLSAGWWDHFAPVSLQVAMLAALATVADALLRRTTWSALRSALWWLVLLRLLLPARLPSPFAGGGLVPASLAEVPAPGAGDSLAASSSISPLAAALFALWVAGAGTLVLLTVRRAIREHRALLAGSRPAAGPVAAAVGRAARRLRLRRLPQVRVGGGIAAPMVAGVVRPVVYLPEGDLDGLDHVVLHELVHIRRRDPLVAGIVVLMQHVFWFHPAVWIARSRLSALRELGCDATVASILGNETPAYRHTLLHHAARRHGLLDRRPLLGELGLLGRGSRIVRRLELLERPTLGRHLARRRCAAFVLAVAVVLVLFPTAPKQGVTLDDLEAFVEDGGSPSGCLHHRYAILKRLYESEDRNK